MSHFHMRSHAKMDCIGKFSEHLIANAMGVRYTRGIVSTCSISTWAIRWLCRTVLTYPTESIVAMFGR